MRWNVVQCDWLNIQIQTCTMLAWLRDWSRGITFFCSWYRSAARSLLTYSLTGLLTSLTLPYSLTLLSSCFALLFPFFGIKLIQNSLLSSLRSKKSKSHFSCDLKKFLRLPTNSILSPSEYKQCPLTLASVIACVDSADELRFWSMKRS